MRRNQANTNIFPCSLYVSRRPISGQELANCFPHDLLHSGQGGAGYWGIERKDFKVCSQKLQPTSTISTTNHQYLGHRFNKTWMVLVGCEAALVLWGGCGATAHCSLITPWTWSGLHCTPTIGSGNGAIWSVYPGYCSKSWANPVFSPALCIWLHT